MLTRLGQYELLSEISIGEMGAIYESFDPILNRKVAVKLLRGDLSKNPSFVEAFLREARNAAAITHSNIIQIHSVEQESDQYFVVMELLKGRPLHKILAQTGPLLEKRVLGIGIDCVKALQAGYARKMIHGDISPH